MNKIPHSPLTSEEKPPSPSDEPLKEDRPHDSRISTEEVHRAREALALILQNFPDFGRLRPEAFEEGPIRKIFEDRVGRQRPDNRDHRSFQEYCEGLTPQAFSELKQFLRDLHRQAPAILESLDALQLRWDLYKVDSAICDIVGSARPEMAVVSQRVRERLRQEFGKIARSN